MPQNEDESQRRRDLTDELSTIGLFFCLFGFLVQIIFTIFDLTNPDMVTAKHIHRVEHFDLPGFVLCFPKFAVTNLTAAEELFHKKNVDNQINNNSRINDEDGIFLQKMSKLTIKEQHSITLKVKQFEFVCFLETYPNFNGLFACDDIYYILPSMVLGDKCFDFIIRTDKYRLTNQAVPRRGQFRITFIKPIQRGVNINYSPKQSHVKIHIHNPQEPMIFWGGQFIGFNMYTYESVDIQLELKHFVTKSRFWDKPCTENYDQLCSENCLYHDYPSKMKKWLPTVPGTEHNIMLTEEHDALNHGVKQTNVIRECEEQCPKILPCNTITYSGSIISENVADLSRFYQISMTPPKYIEITEFKPRLSMLDFICNLYSTFNMWLGASLFSIICLRSHRRLVNVFSKQLTNIKKKLTG